MIDVQFFGSPTAARLAALLCYAKIAPNPAERALLQGTAASKAKNGLNANR
jgi:hypothetical protein